MPQDNTHLLRAPPAAALREVGPHLFEGDQASGCGHVEGDDRFAQAPHAAHLVEERPSRHGTPDAVAVDDLPGRQRLAGTAGVAVVPDPVTRPGDQQHRSTSDPQHAVEVRRAEQQEGRPARDSAVR